MSPADEAASEGARWLACQLNEQLELDRFRSARLPDSREGTWHILETPRLQP